MKIENQLVSLELAKQMKAAGFPQGSEFYWVDVYENIDQFEKCWQIHHIGRIAREEEFCHPIAAYTVSELGEMLPARILNKATRNWDFVRFHKGDDSKQDNREGFTVEYHTEFYPPLCRVTGKTEADARAQMLLYLKKEGLI